VFVILERTKEGKEEKTFWVHNIINKNYLLRILFILSELLKQKHSFSTFG